MCIVCWVIDSLEDAVRDKISQCSAESYTHLSLDAAQRLFNFKTREDLLDYCGLFEDWQVDNDRIVFPEKKAARLARDDIPSKRTVQEVLSFAARLERIV